MEFLQLREPFSAISHGVGMLLAPVVTWQLLSRTLKSSRSHGAMPAATAIERLVPVRPCLNRLDQGKLLGLMIFGFALIICYASSALFHGVPASDEVLGRLQRLDHVGIYLLIAGTYTPVALTMLHGAWRRWTLRLVWGLATLCGTRVWCGGIFPIWLSTSIYLALGWGSLVCYRELARTYSHRALTMLPLGGVMYSVGAMINLAHCPSLLPGILGPHELFHIFVLAGSGCHIRFMLDRVIPASPSQEFPTALAGRFADVGRRLIAHMAVLLPVPAPHAIAEARPTTDGEGPGSPRQHPQANPG